MTSEPFKMKKLFLVIFTVLFCLISNVGWTASWKDTVCKYTGFNCPEIDLSMELNELVEREGLYYQKFSQVPFTGEISGNYQGSIRMVRQKVNGLFTIKMELLDLKKLIKKEFPSIDIKGTLKVS